MTDDELMERVADGDEEAARLLVQRWEGPIYAFLDRMLGSREDAQDLGQDTFIKVCSEAGRYEPSGKFRSWLFKIAGNLARSRLRRRRIISWVSFSPGVHEGETSGDDPGVDLERKEAAREVRGALARLPARQRQAIVLRTYNDLSYREVAEAMGVSIPAVESLLQRGMAALRRELGAGEAESEGGGRKLRETVSEGRHLNERRR